MQWLPPNAFYRRVVDNFHRKDSFYFSLPHTLLQLPPTTTQTQNTASISLDEKARIVGGEYFSRLFTPTPLTSLSLSRIFSFHLSLWNRRGRNIYAAERDKRQWTSNVAILKCRYQSHVHLFQPSCLLPAFLTSYDLPFLRLLEGIWSCFPR